MKSKIEIESKTFDKLTAQATANGYSTLSEYLDAIADHFFAKRCNATKRKPCGAEKLRSVA